MEERTLHGILKCVHLRCLHHRGLELSGLVQLRGVVDLPRLQPHQPLHLLHTVHVHDHLRLAR